MKEKIGQRGKQAEKIVETVLKKWNSRVTFAYWRLPDSRSARSFLVAQPGDYCFFSGSHAGIIEVKSSLHPSRIAKDKISQLPILQKLALAGASSVILIHHSEIDKWRVLYPSDLAMNVPSWELSVFPLFDSAEDALISTGYFVL